MKDKGLLQRIWYTYSQLDSCSSLILTKVEIEEGQGKLASQLADTAIGIAYKAGVKISTPGEL